MPSAIQFGMPLDEFWHGDMRLLQAYQKAYMRNVSFTSWLNGKYNMIAYSLTLANAFAKKGEKLKDFPEFKDPIESMKKTRITQSNLEEEFRKQQCQQMAFISSMINKSDGRK